MTDTVGTGPPLALIVAVARNGIIGSQNRLPWSVPSDLRHFRALTMGKPVLMGRRTFESIGRPLPGRHLVVLSGGIDAAPPGVTLARTLDEAVAVGGDLARAHCADEIMVAGGGALYDALIGRARRLYLTEIDDAPEGDTSFPTIALSQWRETARKPAPRDPRDERGCAFVIFERIAKAP